MAGGIFIVTGDTRQIKSQMIIEIEKIRYELENLIQIKKYSFDDEVLRTSKKLDEILNEYHKL